jgi:CHRD domain/PEP-CTERM motif
MKPKLLLAGLVLALGHALPAAAHTQQYSTSMSGLLENPAQMTPGVGVALVTLDFDTFMMRVQAGFNGLVGDVTIAHIHCCVDAPGNVGVATPTPTFPGFPAGDTFGFYDRTFDMSQSSSYNAAFITNNGGTVGSAFNAFAAGLDDGRAYFNIHTTFAGGGEIRGFLNPIPEPGTYAMMLAGLGLLGLVAARRRKLRS